MVGGEAVDDVHVLPECFLILLGAQDGSHLCTTLPQERNIICREEEMVGTYFAGNVDSLLLHCTDH